MAKEMVNTITAIVISVVDLSFGGFERDGKAVDRVERYSVWVLLEFGQEPIGPLVVTCEQDLAVARRLAFAETVRVRISTIAGTDRWGNAYLQHRAPRDGGPVFVGPNQAGPPGGVG